MNTHELIKNIKVLIVLVSLTVGASYAQAAFVGPPGPAPTCPSGQPGCDAPLNVGSATQVKGSSVGNGAIWSKGSIGTDGGGIFGGSVKVGNTTVPNAKAALDIESTTKGILPPRLTTAQRDAITTGLSAAEKTALDGLTIYNTDPSVNGLERFDGTTWGPAVSVSAAAGVDGPSFYARKSANMNGPASASAAWSAYPYIFDQIIGPNGNTDPCAPTAGNCTRGADGRAWGYDPATGVFKPSVPGRYIITVAVQPQVYNSGGYSQLNLLKNGSSIANTYGYDNGVEYRTDSLSVVVDANGTTDFFSVQVQVYNSTIIWSGSTYSYFSGSRVGNPATVNQQTTYNVTNAPIGSVIFFDGAACPTAQGYTEFTEGRGRYVVGLPSGGTLKGTSAGAPLSNLEERNRVGDHTHTTNINHYHTAVTPNHQHSYLGFSYPGAHSVANDSQSVSVLANSWSWQTWYNTSSSGGGVGFNTYDMINTGYSDATARASSGAIGNTSSQTNAPYIQLLVCKKTS